MIGEPMAYCPSCKTSIPEGQQVCPTCGSVPQELVQREGRSCREGDSPKAGHTGLVLAGKYRLVELLGEGAMGWVYRGVHLTLESAVAVKIMKPPDRPDSTRAARFVREARAASRLNHPHIISVIDFGETPHGLCYLVTELLRGQPLSEVLQKEGVLPLSRAIGVTKQILSALEESHNAGVVHRDMKPDNIMMTQLRGGEDFVKVLDFGIAKVTDDQDQKLTQHGQLFGTPDYMAPEQIKGKALTGAADLYSVGVMLFQMLTGRLPFVADNLFDLLKSHLTLSPPRLADVMAHRIFPPGLQLVLDRAMSKEPEQRFENARMFRRALRNAVREDSDHTIRCPSCKHRISENARFCPDCGRKIRDTRRFRALLATVADQPLSDFDERPLPSGSSERTEDSFLPIGAGAPRTATRESHPTLDRLWMSASFDFPMLPREKEMEVVGELLDGRRSIVVFSGGVGLGKTSLCRHAASRAEESGTRVRWVAPATSLERPGWTMVREVVSRTLGIGDPPQAIDLEAKVEACPALARDLPGLMGLFDLSGPLDLAEPSVRLNEVLSAAARAVVICTTEPTLYLFEDCDLYPRPCLLFLGRLGALCRDKKVRVMATTSVDVFGSEIQKDVIALSPLDEQTVLDLMGRIGMRSTDSWHGVCDRIIANGQGNPLWIRQALALAAESGVEHEGAIADLMAIRVRRLPASVRRLLMAVSVLGVEATEKELTSILGGKGPSREDVALAVHLGLLEEIGSEDENPPDDYCPRYGAVKTERALRLMHPLLATVICEGMPNDLRQELNQAAFELRASQRAPRTLLAHHLAQSGLHEEALPALQVASELAMDSFDPHTAVILLRRAMEILRFRLLADDDDPRYIDIYLKLADALQNAGDLDASQVVLKSVESIAASQPEFLARIRKRLARVLMDQNRKGIAVELMQRANGDAIRSGDVEVMVETYLDLARLRAEAGDAEAAFSEIEQGVELVTAGQGYRCEGGPVGLWKLLLDGSLLLTEEKKEPRRTKEAISWAEAALRQAKRVGSVAGAARAHLVLAELDLDRGFLKLASDHFLNALISLRSLGDREGQARLLLRSAERGLDIFKDWKSSAYELALEVGWVEGMDRVRAFGARG